MKVKVKVFSIYLGLVNWNNRIVYRAMDAKTYKRFKPVAYEFLRTNYDNGEEFNESDDEIEFPSIDSLFKKIDQPPLSTKLSSSATASSSTNQITCVSKSATDLALAPASAESILNTTAELKELLKKKITNLELVGIFRCFVCFESNPSRFMSCFFCGRFLGCFSCISFLDRCPLCRKAFKCTACETPFPKNPLFIPGLTKFIPDESVGDENVAPLPALINVDTDEDEAAD